MKYFSMFSGIGGFELGIQQAYEGYIEQQHFSQESEQEKFTQGRVRATNQHGKMLRTTNGSAPLCVGYSEIDRYAIQVYEKHFPKHQNYGDCTKTIATELPDFDLLVGGFPCQAFSIAGKRKGFDDTRGTLFFDIARIAKEKRPKYLLLENVKGLLSHDNGRTYKTILSALIELGYDIRAMVLNSKNFGVPQNRERVFIAGCLGGWGGREVFSFGEGGTVSFTEKRGKQEGGERISSTIDSRYRALRNAGETYLKQIVGGSMGERVYDETGIATSIRAEGGGHGKNTGLYAVPKSRLARQFIREFSESLSKLSQQNTSFRIRRLTPVETERLQGFPDGWTAEGTQGKISDTQRYKMCGNAVTVNVVKEIMKTMLWKITS